MNRVLCRFASAMTVASLVVELTVAPAFGDDTSTQTVEQLAEQAYEQHAAGKYADSIATYLKAYEISKTSEILFNVATIYDRKLHERELAADYYRRYIRQPDATPDLVKRATERLTGLKREAEEEQARRVAAPPVMPTPGTVPSQPAATEVPASPDAGWRTTGIIVGATGVAGILASLALGAAAKTRNDAANSECSGASCGTEQGVIDARDAGNYATWSTVVAAAGGALLVGGVVLFLAAPRRPSAARVGTTLSVAPQLGGRGGGLSLSASF